MLSYIFTVIAGFLILVYGAEYFVSGSSSVAKRLGISSFVIGLTIVAIGTSAPEFFVNVIAAFQGATSLSIGNILGSNTTDILLGLGLASIVTPLTLKKGTIWKEIPFSLLAVILILIFGMDMFINGVGPDLLTRSEGIALLGLFIVFIAYTFGLSTEEGVQRVTVDVYSWGKSIAFILGGVLALIIGGKLVVDGAVNIATALGWSENLIGLTIVAIGTSLPEIATAISAAKKGQVDMVVGGIVGTIIFNSLFALGSTAVVRALPFSGTNATDAAVLLIATIILFASLFVGKKRTIGRSQGIMFITLYIAYIVFAIIRG